MWTEIVFCRKCRRFIFSQDNYQNGSKKGYMHKNWGETKGEDKYTDVCVLLNKTTSKKMAAGKLAELAPMTKNKLYVAITRAKGNVYIFDE